MASTLVIFTILADGLVYQVQIKLPGSLPLICTTSLAMTYVYLPDDDKLPESHPVIRTRLLCGSIYQAMTNLPQSHPVICTTLLGGAIYQVMTNLPESHPVISTTLLAGSTRRLMANLMAKKTM